MTRAFTVLHVTEAFGSGVVSAFSELVARTPELDHHLLRTVRTADHTDGEGTQDCASVLDLPAAPVAAHRAVRQAVRRIRPDVVHAHSSWAGLYVRLAVNARRTRVVYTPHGYGFLRTDIPRWRRLLIREIERTLTWNTSVLAACSLHEDSLARMGRRGMERLVVPNVVEVAAELVDQHRRSRRPGVLVACGRLQPIRDPGYFVRLVDEVRTRNPAVEARWLGGRAGKMAETLEAHGIEVTGWLPRSVLLSELAEASVYVHTSAWDGFPMTMLEAISIGVPTVAKRIPQLEECPAAVLFDSPTALADEVAQMLDTPMTEAEHQALWQPFLAEHSPELQRRQLLAAYGVDADRS